MSWFKKKQKELPPVPMATAKVELYALGNVIRIGDRIRSDSPIFLNTQWAFDIDPEEMRKHHGL